VERLGSPGNLVVLLNISDVNANSARFPDFLSGSGFLSISSARASLEIH
jgi:hypothetical protein